MTRMPSVPRASGVRAIILYKAAKSVVQSLLAVVLSVLLARGQLTPVVHAVARVVREGLSGAWSVRLAERIVGLATRGHLVITIVALALDAVLSALEGWALWDAKWWGPWLVVVATSGLIPFEVFELIRRPRLARGALLLLNLAVVAYLARRALRERHLRARRDEPG